MDEVALTIKFYSEGRWQSHPVTRQAAWELWCALSNEFVQDLSAQSAEPEGRLKVLLD